MASSVSCSHALVCDPTSKRSASDGGLFSGQPMMMWRSVQARRHSLAALPARPHVYREDWKRPASVHRRLSQVHCGRGRSSSLTPPPGRPDVAKDASGQDPLPCRLTGRQQPLSHDPTTLLICFVSIFIFITYFLSGLGWLVKLLIHCFLSCLV